MGWRKQLSTARELCETVFYCGRRANDCSNVPISVRTSYRKNSSHVSQSSQTGSGAGVNQRGPLDR